MEGYQLRADYDRFNEAAGIPRGRQEGAPITYVDVDASMRPRVFPAEDAVDLQNLTLIAHASMRPRVFPAEDTLEFTASNWNTPLQ